MRITDPEATCTSAQVTTSIFIQCPVYNIKQRSLNKRASHSDSPINTNRLID